MVALTLVDTNEILNQFSVQQCREDNEYQLKPIYSRNFNTYTISDFEWQNFHIFFAFNDDTFCISLVMSICFFTNFQEFSVGTKGWIVLVSETDIGILNLKKLLLYLVHDKRTSGHYRLMKLINVYMYFSYCNSSRFWQ